jgi:hypothetical protein
MSFLAPGMLWSLAVLVPLAAIYFLKVRPRRRPTTAYFLWEKIFQEKRSSSLFQRLRDVMSLLLMALAAAGVCLALAQPEWQDERQDLLVVIDNTASMAARDGRTTRLDEAKQLAREIVAGLNGSQRAAVATAARALNYRSHLTDNPRELLDAIEAIEVAPQGLSDAAIAELADAGGKFQRRRRVLLISDGSFDEARLAKNVELFKVGGAADNIGLIAADMAYLPGGENRLGVYFQTASSSAAPRECDLNIVRLDDDDNEQLLRVIPLRVAPGVNSPENFVLEDAPAGRWIARLTADDALQLDDVAYLAARKAKPIPVAVESADRFFLENSVQAFGGGDGLLTLVSDKADVVIAKSKSPDVPRAVIFQPAGESPWWTELGDEAAVGAPKVLRPEHPALAHLDAGTIPFVGTRQLKAPAGAQVLVADDAGLPLIYLARREGRSAVVVNLDPVSAEFYFSAWFPVLVHSSVMHLVGRETPLAATYRPGEMAPTLASSDEAASKLIVLGEQPREMRGKSFPLPDRLGFCELQNEAGAWQVPTSLLSEQESLISNQAAADSRQPISRGKAPAHWLTVLAIVLLTGESILYHRRKVG